MGPAGLVVGVLLGGVLTQTFGWSAVFFVNVPLAAGALLLAFTLLPPDRQLTARRNLDLPGAFSATLGLTLLVFALVEGPNLGWASPGVVVTAVAGALLLATFAAIERHSADPLFSTRLLENRNLRTAVAIAFLFWAAFGSVLYLLSVYLQNVRGYDALHTGLGFVLPSTVVVAGSSLAGPLVTRFGLRSTLVVALAIGS
jgi:predicted MFS family arabinose efflux permease